MEYNNNATRIRREILIRIARDMFEKQLIEHVDRIPYDMRPLNDNASRCCIYKDRAVLRYRCMAAMGFALENETDDFTPLANYAKIAQERKALDGPIMTVLNIACKGCIASRYLVTDACQGCLARPCEVNCPFDAIQFENGRAKIDSAKCKNCGKCQTVCPYHAITRVPVPCEEACPVGAIKKNAEGKTQIDFDACISCGRCMRSCPFGAVLEKSQLVDVIRVLQQKDTPIVAMIAPAIAGQFPGNLEQVAEALQQLGFDKVVEVAYGADITADHEADEFLARIKNGDQFMTTSCCPAYVESVKKHIPSLKPFVSETATPMHYTAEWVKKEIPDAITVFIGPCVAKRREGLDDPYVDYVLTFEETGAMLVARDIEVSNCKGVGFDKTTSAEARKFPISGGVVGAVKARCGDCKELNPIYINGLEPKALKKLAWYAAGNCPGTLVEVMACEGGCIAGAGVLGAKNVATRAVEAWSKAGESLIKFNTNPKEQNESSEEK